MQAALDILTKLKGIGPATASLLLTVHDPNRVIFFSDEAFYWLCCKGKKGPIKYTVKEYQSLRSVAEVLSGRLEVSATDIEKVAFVLMRRTAPTTSSKDIEQPKRTHHANMTTPASAKRKADPDNTTSQNENTLRRSKRTKT